MFDDIDPRAPCINEQVVDSCDLSATMAIFVLMIEATVNPPNPKW